MYNKDLEAHVTHVHKTLEILQKNQLYAKVSKCVFFQASVEYLGHIVSADRLAVDLAKV